MKLKFNHLVPNSILIVVGKGFHDTNPAHWIAVELVWSAVFVLVASQFILHLGMSLVDMYWWIGLALNVAAAMWIGAGVIYVKPRAQVRSSKELANDISALLSAVAASPAPVNPNGVLATQLLTAIAQPGAPMAAPVSQMANVLATQLTLEIGVEEKKRKAAQLAKELAAKLDGVPQKKNSTFATLAEIEDHVTETFSIASRHCIIGLCLFFVGNLLQLAERSDWLKAVG